MKGDCPHGVKYGICHDSWFAGQNLTLKEPMQKSFFWSHSMPEDEAQREGNFSVIATVEW